MLIRRGHPKCPTLHVPLQTLGPTGERELAENRFCTPYEHDYSGAEIVSHEADPSCSTKRLTVRDGSTRDLPKSTLQTINVFADEKAWMAYEHQYNGMWMVDHGFLPGKDQILMFFRLCSSLVAGEAFEKVFKFPLEFSSSARMCMKRLLFPVLEFISIWCPTISPRLPTIYVSSVVVRNQPPHILVIPTRCFVDHQCFLGVQAVQEYVRPCISYLNLVPILAS